MYKFMLPIILAILVAACAPTREPGDNAAMARSTMPTADKGARTRLAAVLAAQPEETQARYAHRHPQETLEFFGIKPGMTVVEALPGRGWYSKILLGYLGSNGHLIGADYAVDMYPLFGFFSDEFVEEKKSWTVTWPKWAEEWRDENSASVSAFAFGSAPDEFSGKADAVLFIRALHNLSRFESKGGFLNTALADAHRLLKPGGLVGVVQHEAREQMPDSWADGSRGYLKKKILVATFDAAGFDLVGIADINANPKDQPTESDVVWRLPPTYLNTEDDLALHTAVTAIGESHRMTLKFRKR